MQPPASPPEPRCVSDCRTLFSSRPFVEAWARAMGRSHRAWVFHRCQGFRDLYGVGRRVASGLYDVALGPSGLYASPEMEDGCSGAPSAGSSRSFAASESRASHGMSGLIMSAWQRCWRHSNCPYSEPAPTCALAESYEKIFAVQRHHPQSGAQNAAQRRIGSSRLQCG